MDWRLQKNALVAHSRIHIEETRNLVKATRGLKLESRSRIFRQALRKIEARRTDRPKAA